MKFFLAGQWQSRADEIRVTNPFDGSEGDGLHELAAVEKGLAEF